MFIYTNLTSKYHPIKIDIIHRIVYNTTGLIKLILHTLVPYNQ